MISWRAVIGYLTDSSPSGVLTPTVCPGEIARGDEWWFPGHMRDTRAPPSPATCKNLRDDSTSADVFLWRLIERWRREWRGHGRGWRWVKFWNALGRVHPYDHGHGRVARAYLGSYFAS